VISTSIIRQDTDYAIRALLHLAGEDTFVSGQELARRCKLPVSFTYKIMRRLVHAGVASSRAGRAGGFTLARKPAEIALTDIIEAVQGAVNVRPCVVDPELCVNSNLCLVSCQWIELQESISRFFEQTTLGSLQSAMRSAGPQAPSPEACGRPRHDPRPGAPPGLRKTSP